MLDHAGIHALLQEYGAADACAAELLCDRHPASAVATTIVEADLTSVDYTYGELRERSERLAAALAELGVVPGDRVATLMGKTADLLVAVLGIWRAGAVHVPLFTAFAPPAVAMRLRASSTKVVIADGDQRAKLEPSDDIPADPPWRVVTTGSNVPQGDLALAELLMAYDPGFPAVPAGGAAPLIQLYTSGTTGEPKGVVVPLSALAAFEMYMRQGLWVVDDDVFWNIADPGWAYGLYYAVVGPLLVGHRTILANAGFSPEFAWGVLSRFGVSNFAAAPTVYRALRAAGTDAPKDLALRRCSSAGEPLNPDVNGWAEQTLGVRVRDHYGQTELGMVAANAHHPDLLRDQKPGSMGYPLPGWSLAVLQEKSDDPAAPGELGRLAVNVPESPAMFFTGYHEAPDRTAERFSEDGRWYHTGDAGYVDPDGAFFFSARDDDVIISAGYRIGPFEVESVIMEHPSVAEVAVVGAPDELRGHVIEAYVTLRPEQDPSPQLETEIQELVKTRYAAHAYPRRVHFLEALPKTPSGKVQRFLLRTP